METTWNYSSDSRICDVTSWFEAKIKNKSYCYITLPEHFNEAWGDVHPMTSKKLEVKVKTSDNIYEFRISENARNVTIKYPFNNICEENLNVHIVIIANLYFYSLYFLKKMLQQFIKSGLYQISHIHLFIISDDDNSIKEDKINDLFENKMKVHIKILKEWNKYEDLSYIYNLTQTFPNHDYLLYYKLSDDKLEFDHFITEWRKCLFIFENFTSINKIGIYVNDKGLTSKNNWWTRFSFLKTLEKPINSNNPKYYDEWISRSPYYDNETNEELLFTRENYFITYVDSWNLIGINNINLGIYLNEEEQTLENTKSLFFFLS